MRVLLADDHALFRAGVASLLRAWGIDVVGEASDGNEALEKVRRLRPDVVLMDIGMPTCDGLEATRLIKAEMPTTTIVMVTVSEDDDDLFEAIKNGAEGYLLKGMSEAELSRVLEAVARGQPALSPSLAAKIIEEFARANRPDDPKATEPLTQRESEVLQLVAAGATNREIASNLGLSENTVNFHVRNILAKLHLKNRVQAAAYAISAGLAEPSPSDED